MRMILTLAAPLLAFATASSTMSPGGSTPDPTVEYNQNVDCHSADTTNKDYWNDCDG